MAGLGALILVVGPSGVGKDTLLDGAREALATTGRFFFPRRVITRPDNAGGEDHIAMSEEDFGFQETAGDFLLSWRAHNLCYGIPKAPAENARQNGQAVVVNVSRGVLDSARNRLQPVSAIAINASAGTLRTRLEARGREDADDIAARLARAAAFDVKGCDVFHVLNDGAQDAGISAMVAALEAASSLEWNPAE